MAAAAAWDELATELQSTAASYSSVISSLTSGPGQVLVARHGGRGRPYLAWMQQTAVQAPEAADQATEAASAYETAFAAHVPPEEIRPPFPIGVAGGYEHYRAEQRGDRSHRSRVRRNVGTGRGGDGHLRRLIGGRVQLDTV